MVVPGRWTFKKKGNTPSKIILSKESFDFVELQYLKEFLEKNFDLIFSIDKQKRLILYDQASILFFLKLVRPYLALERKDINFSSIKLEDFPTKHRTTIYLPVKLKITKPTSKIRESLSFLPAIINDLENSNDYYNFYKKFYKEESLVKSY